MTASPAPLRFGHHALGVLGAATLGATAFALLWTGALGVAMGQTLPGVRWLVFMASLVWITAFIIILPSAGLVFTLLWPVTRRRSLASHLICLLAGAMMGIVFAPMTSPKAQGASLLQFCTCAVIGIAVASFYILLIRQRGAATMSNPGKLPSTAATSEESTVIAV